MPDVLIIKRRDWAYLFGESHKGSEFINSNYGRSTSNHRIQSEYVEDLIESLEDMDLTVEVR